MYKFHHDPPLLFLRFFRWFCHPELRDPIEGDLMELYGERFENSGKRGADLRFIRDVLLLFRPGIIRPYSNFNYLNQKGMFRNYLKIAWRHMLKRKMYSFLNVAGLTAGMAVVILIGLWIVDEISFNKNFKQHSRLAEVMVYQSLDTLWNVDIAIAVPNEYPIRNNYSGDIRAVSLVSQNDDYHILINGDKNLSGYGRWVQSDFPSMFTLNMLSGTRDALKDPSTMLISQKLGKALFGEKDPFNKILRVDNRFDLRVGGVYEDLPANCTFSGTQYLLPWDNKANWHNSITDWDNHTSSLFVLLSDKADFDEVARKIRNIPTPHIKAWNEELLLQPLDRLHLYNEYEKDQVNGGRIEFVWMYGIIGVFVLLLACINFMNLSTARSEQRAREVGIRKTAGSLRGQLISQFLMESVLMAVVALALAIIVVNAALPYFNFLTDKHMRMPWTNLEFWLMTAGFTLFTGFMAGSYPAFYLSGIQPIRVLKGTTRTGRGAVVPRKVLVVLQFTVSITLIIGTLVVFRQIQYAKDRPAGFDRSGLITITMNTPELHDHYEALRNEIMKTGVVENMAESSQSPAHFTDNNSVDWPGKDPAAEIFFRNVSVSSEFGKTIDWTIVRGRDFSGNIISDSSAAIINELAVKTMGLHDPIGVQVQFGGKDFTIIGVASDMITQSPYDRQEPAIFLMKGWYGVIIIRLKSGIPFHEAITEIEPVFRKTNPDSPFEYRFVDEVYRRKFADEERIGKLAGLFASLAIFISCLGIFGLAAFTAERRTKELGIRKVLGATVVQLWRLMSGNFLVLVTISFLISVPFISYFMSDWLDRYNYHTTLPWWAFLVVGVGALLITLATVSVQALRVAGTNPVKSLRSE